MSIKNHPHYQQELKHLDETVTYMNEVIEATEEYKKIYKENIKEAYGNLDPSDSSNSYINIIMNSKFMDEASKNYDNYIRARKKPYFARIDIEADSNKKERESFYIGKTSLFTADHKPVIIDWRSPLASIYYEGRLGEVTYETLTGEENVDLLLKRQYVIEEAKLIEFMDIDLTATDSFLQASLEASADQRLKDIATTIQAEQNRVIRADMLKPLIVQGVAGSGKTTIALHRIAYFIYTYETSFYPENFMIVTPNKLFINYISEVLPELGVEDVKQTTYYDLMVELLGEEYGYENAYKNMKILIQDKPTNEKDLLQWVLAFKGSLTCQKIINNYLEAIKVAMIPTEDFVIDGQVLMSSKGVKTLLLEDLDHLPLYKRMKELEKNLKYKLNQRKERLLQEKEKVYDVQIQHIRNTEAPTEERRLKLVSLIDERDEALNQLKKEIRTAVKNYLQHVPKKKLITYYKELFTDVDHLMTYSKGELTIRQSTYLKSHIQNHLKNKAFDLDDYTALVYLQHALYGFDVALDIKTVVIDEAQDYSLFQLYALKKILKTEKFTLLGDLSQGIYSYRGIRNWEDVRQEVFTETPANYMTLVQSYRTTVEIMNFANKILQKLPEKMALAEPVLRHGQAPLILEEKSDQNVFNSIYHQLQTIEGENYQSIAIICKTLEECKKVKAFLNQKGLNKITLLEEDQTSYQGGIMLVPSYLAKGLEFDVVIISVFDETYSLNPLDVKLLYVAITRALHRLIICYKEGQMIPL